MAQSKTANQGRRPGGTGTPSDGSGRHRNPLELAGRNEPPGTVLAGQPDQCVRRETAPALPDLPRDGPVRWEVNQLARRARRTGHRFGGRYHPAVVAPASTRLLLLPEPGALPNLGSCLVRGMLCRLSDDWKATHGHPLELAETFVDPEKHHGTVYRASNWAPVGLTKGYARGQGGSQDCRSGQGSPVLFLGFVWRGYSGLIRAS